MAQDTSAGSPSRLFLAFALLACPLGITSTACSGPSAADHDTGQAKKSPKATVARSYDNPDVDLSDQEFAEIEGFCKATVECVRELCDAGEHKAKFKRVRVKTNWGKTLQSHFMHESLDRVGWRLGQLVDQEGLHHRSPACRQVRARFD